MRWGAAILALGLAACQTGPETVSADRYDSFWLWAGVKPQPALTTAKTIYIVQGEVTARDPAHILPLRSGTPHVEGRDIWMVVRIETLDWPPETYTAVLAGLVQWRAAGNQLVGLQIDFDARTRHLEGYAAFLADLRKRLPAGTKLSVTGLLDWSANGDPAGLKALAGAVDEVVLQTYQGRHTIPGYQAYLNKLDDLPMPFRIGLVQGGEWKAPASLARNPRFKGFVVFLVNQTEVQH
jgi:hypothetical protein